MQSVGNLVAPGGPPWSAACVQELTERHLQLGLFCWIRDVTGDVRGCCWCNAPVCRRHRVDECGQLGCTVRTMPAPPRGGRS